MKKALLIIDPQNDFITGSLPVPEAEASMERLASILSEIPMDEIYVTLDFHPLDHCSFTDQGGVWPSHCVRYSEGSAIFEPLMQALKKVQKPIFFLEKGTNQDKEEYSAFAERVPKGLRESDVIYIAGIAGDVCVHTSVSDLISHQLASKLCIISDCSPSLDGGEKLDTLVKNLALCSIDSTHF